MSNEEQFQITVRYPAFEDNGHKFPAYGVKYLFRTNIIPFPDWPEEDERWLRWDPSKEVAKRFIEWYKNKNKPEFDGEILFIEPAQFSLATDIESPER